MRRLLAALALVVLIAPAVRAASDPARQWFTVATDHFAVHSYDGGRALAGRAAAWCEEAYEALNALLGWTPDERVHVLLVDDVDAANGFAGVMPYDGITLFAYPPPMGSDLADHDDWLRLLIFHEYAHIAHLDHARRWPQLINRVLGKVTKPNQNLPRWLTEGIATWVETRSSGAGRVGSSRFEMILRAAALADRLPALSELTGAPLQLPRGTSWYLYGGYLVEHIVRHTVPTVMGVFAADYGSRSIPYGMNVSSRRATGKDLLTWHGELMADVARRARRTAQRVRDEGLVEGERLTRGGEGKDVPAWSPDGRWLYYVRHDGQSTGRIVRVAAASPLASEDVVECDGGCGHFVPSADGRTLVVPAGRPHRVVSFYTDLVEVPVAGGRNVQDGRWLTRGARAADPAWSADGRTLWTVRSAWGETWLEALDARTGRSVARWTPPAGARLDWPVPHPDGRRIFASMHVDGNRDLVEIDLPGGGWRRLTHGPALELDPTLSPDGRWLVFAADPHGIYDLFAREVDPQPGTAPRTVQLTRVLTGAFEPAISPNGRELVYVGWTVDGDELYRMPFTPAEGSPVTRLDPRPPRTAPSPPTDVVRQTLGYRYLPTLLPRSWQPSVTFGTGGLALAGLALAATDITGRLGAQLSAEWDFTRRDVTAFAGLGVGVGFVDIGVGAGRFTRDRFTFFDDRFEDYLEEVFFGSVDLSVPLPGAAVGMRASMSYGVDLSRAVDRAPVEHAPDELQPYEPREGVSTSLGLSWSFSDVESYAFSISAERGTSGSLSLRLRHPAIGSHATSYTMRTSLFRFVPMPWRRNQVLSLSLRAGWAGGDPDARGGFSIGGVPRQDLLFDLLNQVTAGSAWLRGFPEGAFGGTSFQLATAEYRLPLWRIRRGVETLPVFLHDLSLAVFTDAGGAWSRPLVEIAGSDLHAGVGAELRVTTDLLFGFVTRFRLGYAHGFGPGGIDHVYLLMAGDP